MKKILFISYGGGHVNALIPIIKKIKQKYSGKYEVSVIGINLASEILKRNNIPCNSLSNYITKPEELELGLEFARKYHDFSSPVSFVDSVAYYGLSLGDLIDELGYENAMLVMKVYDRRLFLPIKSALKILEMEKPDILVTTSMHRFEAASIFAANKLGIPNLRIEDVLGNIHFPFPDKIQVSNIDEKNDLINKGLQSDKVILKSELENPVVKEYARKVYDFYRNLAPTAFAVLCDKAKRNILERGLSEESIYITGHPSFDNLQKLMSLEETANLEIFKSIGKKKIITFMSQPIPTRELTLIKLIRELKKNDDIYLVIKLHPNEDGKVQNKIVLEEKYDALIIKEPSANILSLASDLVITVSSTTALEAAYLNRPVLSICFNNEMDFLGLEEMGLGLHIKDENELLKAINLLTTENSISQRIKEKQKIFSKNNNAVTNIINLINKLLIEEKND